MWFEVATLVLAGLTVLVSANLLVRGNARRLRRLADIAAVLALLPSGETKDSFQVEFERLAKKSARDLNTYNWFTNRFELFLIALMVLLLPLVLTMVAVGRFAPHSAWYVPLCIASFTNDVALLTGFVVFAYMDERGRRRSPEAVQPRG